MTLKALAGTLDEEASSKILQIVGKIQNVRNLSKTMAGLIKNVVSEVENSRNQMFRMMEDLATIEILSKEESSARKGARKESDARDQSRSDSSDAVQIDTM